MKKVLITGGDGYIGSGLYNSLKTKYDVLKIGRTDVDLIKTNEVLKFFENNFFDVVIHAAVIGGSRLKEDNDSVIFSNLMMYQNILMCQKNFNKLIHFGSGAELTSPLSPYGISKNIIKKSILSNKNYFNLRIYAIFDENELETRFIKSNIKRYISGDPMVIHENKKMDFFYMQDLISLVDLYIRFNYLPQEIDCVYNEKYTLFEICNIINNLDDKKVQIDFTGKKGIDYIGKYGEFNKNFIGLEKGIKNTYDLIFKKK